MMVATPWGPGLMSRISITRLSPGSAPRTETGPGGRVHLREVDVGDQIVLGLDLAREAVVGLEGDDLPAAYLQDGLHFRAEGEDGLFLRDGVINPLDRLGHSDLLPICLWSRFQALRSRPRRISPPLEQWPADAARRRAQGPRNPRLSR